LTVRLPRFLIASALVLGLAGTALAQEQSLGDVARKNRKGGTAKVLTNEDLPKSGGGVSSVGQPAEDASKGSSAGSAASADEAASAVPAGQAAVPAAGETDAEVAAMEERLKRLKYDEAGLTRRIAKMEADMEEAETEFRREMYRTGLENARSNLNTITTQREETEKALAESKKGKAGESQAAASSPQQPATAEKQPE
jgi:hypothetical protein